MNVIMRGETFCSALTKYQAIKSACWSILTVCSQILSVEDMMAYRNHYIWLAVCVVRFYQWREWLHIDPHSWLTQLLRVLFFRFYQWRTITYRDPHVLFTACVVRFYQWREWLHIIVTLRSDLMYLLSDFISRDSNCMSWWRSCLA